MERQKRRWIRIFLFLSPNQVGIRSVQGRSHILFCAISSDPVRGHFAAQNTPIQPQFSKDITWY